MGGGLKILCNYLYDNVKWGRKGVNIKKTFRIFILEGAKTHTNLCLYCWVILWDFNVLYNFTFISIQFCICVLSTRYFLK